MPYLVLAYTQGTGAPPTNDPNFADVNLLVKFDGGVYPDLSSYSKTISWVGAPPVINNTTYKYGDGSYENDGTGNDYLSVTGTPAFNFGTGDFTVEAWVNPRPAPGGGVDNDYMVFGKMTSSPPMFFFLSNNNLTPALWDGTAGSYGTSQVTPNVWSHVAWTRASGTLRIFIDGVQCFSGANTINFADSSAMLIGGHGSTLQRRLDGFLDELRVTKGVARYTTNFTPPAGSFPTTA